MRSSTSPLVRDTFLYRTWLPGARLRAAVRPAKVRDASGAVLATVVMRSGAGRWLARAMGAAAFTAAMLAGIEWVTSPWLLGFAVPVLLLLAHVMVLLLSPERGVALLSDAGETLLLVEPEARWGMWRRCRVEDGEGHRLGVLRRSPLRDRFWLLGPLGPLLRVEPSDGVSIEVRRPSAWSPGWVFERAGCPMARYAIRTLPGARDRLEVSDASVDPRLLLAAVLVARP